MKGKIKKLLAVLLSAATIAGMLWSNYAYADDLQVLEQKINVATNKTWTIKLSRRLSTASAQNIKSSVYVTSPRDGVINGVGIKYNDSEKTVTITPPSGGYRTSTTYTIIVKDDLKDGDGTNLKSPVAMEFSTVNSNEDTTALGSKSTYNLGYSLNTLINNQLTINPVVIRYYGYTTNYASYTAIQQYTNPDVFKNDSYGIYQYMNLNFMEGISASSIDTMLQGEGTLDGLGQAFYDACRDGNVNAAYAVSHAILETGHGTSKLAQGYKITDSNGVERTVYNFFGIGAHDSDPVRKGAEYALSQGWFTPELAAKGGVQWIGKSYINSSYKQNTLFKMRWYADSSGTPCHQYATDIAWAYKQIGNLKKLIDKAGVSVKFDIPSYK